MPSFATSNGSPPSSSVSGESSEGSSEASRLSLSQNPCKTFAQLPAKKDAIPIDPAVEVFYQQLIDSLDDESKLINLARQLYSGDTLKPQTELVKQLLVLIQRKIDNPTASDAKNLEDLYTTLSLSRSQFSSVPKNMGGPIPIDTVFFDEFTAQLAKGAQVKNGFSQDFIDILEDMMQSNSSIISL